MADVIRGFNIELGLDKAGVESGLAGLNRTMSRVNSEFSRSLSSFDRGERSMARYDTTLRGLNSKMEVQDKVVGENRRSYDALSKEYDKNRDALGKTSKELTSAEREMDRLMGSTDATAEEFVQAEVALREAEVAFAELNDEVTKNRTELDNAEVALNRAERDYNNLANSVDYYTEEMKQMHIEQSIAESNWTKSGDAIIGFSNGLERVSGVATSVGDSLTRKITMPALGVVTAVGGITAAFGWGRLVDIDVAQAQLRGLGYETEDVERISGQLVDALEGGMMTLGDATSAAATAMAAGVEEGQELTRYIQILDGAVTGSNGTFQEMEQIFGRVIDQGHMTRNEFDMISQRMPGFSSAVQEHMGVGSEAMYQMLRDGEITTDEFLDIMEGFAGDMATEYAKTWPGMIENTKNYVGILGAEILEGTFQMSKEEIAEFIELLSSDEAIEWAQEMGLVLNETFSTVRDSVEDVVNWYQELDDWQQELIWKAGLFAVAVGPVLSVVGRLGGGIATLGKAFGGLFKWIGVKSGTVLGLSTFGKTAGTAAASTGVLAGGTKILGGALAAVTGPIGIAIGVVAALGGAFVLAYNKVDWFRNSVDLAWDVTKIFGEALYEITGLSWLVDQFSDLWDSTELFRTSVSTAMDVVGESISNTFNDWIVEPFENFKAMHREAGETVEVFQDDVSEATEEVLGAYVQMDIEAKEALDDLFYHQGEVTQEMVDDVIEKYGNMNTEASNQLEDRKESEMEILRELFEESGLYTGEELDKRLERAGQHYDREQEDLNLKNDRIEEIIREANESEEGMTDAHYREIEILQQGHNETTVDTLTDGEVEQQAIIDRMSTNQLATSEETVKSLIEDSREARDKTVEEAENKRDDIITEAIRQRDETGELSAEEAAAVIQAAEDTYNDTVGHAEDKHRDVLAEARTQASEHGIIVDGETGDILSKWDVFSRMFTTTMSALASTAKSRAEDIGYNIYNGIVTWINSVIDNVNEISKALGLGSILSTLDRKYRSHTSSNAQGYRPIAAHSRGTDYHMGGHALLGDVGPGNSVGGSPSNTAEIVELPNKKRYMVDGNVIWTDFPQGAKVQSNQESKDELDKIRAYNPETGVGSGMDMLMPNLYSPSVSGSNKVAKAGRSFGGMLKNIYDYMDDPDALINQMLSEIGHGDNHMAQQLIPGLAGKMTGGLVDKVKELFEQSSSTGDGSHILGKPITAHFGRYPAGINFNNGIHYGLDTHHVFDPLLSPINGIVDRIWNDFGGGLSMQIKSGRDYWWFMHLSNVMKSVGDSVTAGMRIATTGNSGNWTTGAHLHTQYMPGAPGNLNAENPLPKLRSLGSFANGGLISQHGYFEGAEGNKPEMILPLTNRSRSIELMMEALSYMGGGQQSENSDNVIKILIEEVKSLKEIIRLLGTEQNKLSSQLLESSRVIEKKENVVFIKDMVNAMNKYKDDRTLAI